MSNYTLLTRRDGRDYLTFVHDGDFCSVDDSHPRFAEIVDLAFDDQTQEAAELVNVKTGVRAAFNKVSDRVSISGDSVFFDNVEVHGELVDQIVEFYNDEEQNFEPLVNFMEKLYVNNNSHSVDQLFRWISNRNLTITPEGDFIAYKGVNKDDTGQYVSLKRGTSIVDGATVTGLIPNAIGSVIEMARADVTFDPTNHCAPGLHAGTWEYASSWGPYVLTVVINPRDVVSVPEDHASQKLRVCRYKVTGITEGPLASRLYVNEIEGVDEDDWDEDELDCDCDYCCDVENDDVIVDEVASDYTWGDSGTYNYYAQPAPIVDNPPIYKCGSDTCSLCN